MSIGRLEDIPQRTVWAREDAHFTPWLSENLDRLQDVLGLQLEKTGIEVPVSEFSADIVAKTADGVIVVIENQLERSDHKHLGQILTYLSGLNAKVVVWIATDFAEAHLSAINWLNANTPPEFGFFAIQLRVVRIGDSLPAPIFDVVIRPNAWERELRARKDADETKEALEKIAFWEHYLTRYASDRELGIRPSAANAHWAPLEDLVIGVWAGSGGCGVYVRGPSGVPLDTVIERLAPVGEQLSAELGPPFHKPGAPNLLNSKGPGRTTDRESWGTMSSWLHEKLHAYRSVLSRVLAESTHG